MNVDRVGAVAVAAGPAALLVGILWHPFIPNLTNNADVVHHIHADAAGWLGAHLVVALGSALLLLGFLATRAHVRSTVGPEPWTGRAIVPLVVGTTLFVMLPAMEIGMLAVDQAGGDLLATQNALDTWFKPTLVSAALMLGVGTILFAVGVNRAHILPRGAAGFVTGAFIVSAVTRLPFTLSLIVGIVALNAAMLPLAVTMWQAGGVERPVPRAA